MLAHASGGGSGGGSPPPPSCPTVSFSFVTQGLALSLTTTSTAGSDPIIAYTWAFGDGQTGTGTKATHTYKKANTYLVQHTVRDVNGIVETVGQLISVTKKGNTTGATALGYHDPMHLHAEGTVAAAGGGPCGLVLVSEGLSPRFGIFSSVALFTWKVLDQNGAAWTGGGTWAESYDAGRITVHEYNVNEAIIPGIFYPFLAVMEQRIGPIGPDGKFSDPVGVNDALLSEARTRAQRDIITKAPFSKQHFIADLPVPYAPMIPLGSRKSQEVVQGYNSFVTPPYILIRFHAQ